MNQQAKPLTAQKTERLRLMAEKLSTLEQEANELSDLTQRLTEQRNDLSTQIKDVTEDSAMAHTQARTYRDRCRREGVVFEPEAIEGSSSEKVHAPKLPYHESAVPVIKSPVSEQTAEDLRNEARRQEYLEEAARRKQALADHPTPVQSKPLPDAHTATELEAERQKRMYSVDSIPGKV
jgi:hypothetical protein